MITNLFTKQIDSQTQKTNLQLPKGEEEDKLDFERMSGENKQSPQTGKCIALKDK